MTRIESLSLTNEALRSAKGLRWASKHLLEHVTVHALGSPESTHGLLLALLLEAGTSHLGAHSLLQGTGRPLGQSAGSQTGTGLLLNHSLLLRRQTGASSQTGLGLGCESVGKSCLLWRGCLDGGACLGTEG